MSFSYLPKIAFDNGGCYPIPFRIFVDHVTIFSSGPAQHLGYRGICDQKVAHGWNLLLDIVRYDNVAGLLQLSVCLSLPVCLCAYVSVCLCVCLSLDNFRLR